MSICWNMNRSVLKNGGRKAPEMALEDFENLFDAALPHLDPDDGRPDDYEMRLFEVVNEDFPYLFKKVLEDFSKIEVSFENFGFSGFRMGSNGVPFAECYFGGDWEVPVTGMIYWDGKAFRGYLPTYGNAFNAKEKAAFGSEGFSSGPYTYSEDGILKTISFKTEEEYRDFFDNNMEWLESDISACNEDFSSRVVSAGEMTNEEFEKALNKVSKQLTKAKMEFEDEEKAMEKAYEKEHKRKEKAEEWKKKNVVIKDKDGRIFCKDTVPNYFITPIPDKREEFAYLIIPVDDKLNELPATTEKVEAIKEAIPCIRVISVVNDNKIICNDKRFFFGLSPENRNTVIFNRIVEIISYSNEDVRLFCQLKKEE